MHYVLLFAIGFGIVSCAHVPASVSPPTWDEERWGQVEQQALDNSCGLAALATIMRHHFGDTRFDERSLLAAYVERASAQALERAMRHGVSLLELQDLAHAVGYVAMRKMLTFADLERVVRITPVLVYLEVQGLRHFAVIRGISEHVVWLADPSRGNVYHTRAQFLSEWRTPERIERQWRHPGGLIILHPERTSRGLLLKTPQDAYPVSFLNLRRSFVIGRPAP